MSAGGRREHQATFVLSTGRCGTQWLAWHLAQHYGPAARVEHEPLHDGYRPRRLLGLVDLERLAPEESAPILRHLAGVEAQLERGPYLEAGHPCWSALPHLAQRFRGRLRIIHLTRHPLPTALSWTTHMAFVPPLLPHLREKVLLSPFDPGVAFPEYQEGWAAMEPFEKCLYYWAELNAFGLRLEQELDVPWLRLSYEELFQGEGLARLHAFLGLADSGNQGGTGEQVDIHRHIAPAWPDLALILRHPRVLETAAALGYDATQLDEAAWQARYRNSR